MPVTLVVTVEPLVWRTTVNSDSGTKAPVLSLVLICTVVVVPVTPNSVSLGDEVVFVFPSALTTVITPLKLLVVFAIPAAVVTVVSCVVTRPPELVTFRVAVADLSIPLAAVLVVIVMSRLGKEVVVVSMAPLSSTTVVDSAVLVVSTVVVTTFVFTEEGMSAALVVGTVVITVLPSALVSTTFVIMLAALRVVATPAAVVTVLEVEDELVLLSSVMVLMEASLA